MEPKGPAKSISRLKETTNLRKYAQNGTKSTQQNALLFVNIADPADRNRKDSRKAVRSFVMKQYKQSQKTIEPLQTREMELEEEDDDAVEDAPARSQLTGDTDSFCQTAHEPQATN